MLKVKIYDFQKNLIGLRRRDVAEGKQWMQPSDCPIFPFNHININMSQMLFIVEGETSAMTVYETISSNIIGTPGTTFKSEWAAHFSQVPGVCIIPDNNYVGSNFAMQIQLQFSELNIPISIYKVPSKYTDISEFFVNAGANAVRNWWEQKTRTIKLLSVSEDKTTRPNIFCFQDFIDYGSTIGDMPYCFLEGLALVALSTILSPKLSWQGTSIMSNLKPNLAVILAADSTRSRKSESLKILLGLMFDLDESILIPQYFSPEALIDIMAEREGKPSLLLRDEWGRFQEKLKKADWTKGTKELLIQLIDGQGFVRRTLSKGTIVVKEPFLSIASAATIESLITSLDESDLLSGYISRLIFIAPTTLRKRKPLTDYSEKSELYSKLLQKFKKLRDNSSKELITEESTIALKGKKLQVEIVAPPYVVTFKNQEILLRFDEFVSKMEELDNIYPHMSPMHTRLAWTVLKIAILLAAAKFFRKTPKTTTIEIDSKILIFAIKLGVELIKYQKNIVKRIGASPLEHTIEQIAKFVKVPKSRSEIMRRYSLNARTTDEIRETMLQRGLVEIVAQKTQTRRKEVWRLR